MESNDNLEQLLKRMYAHEEEDIDTSDIIDDEWTKFEAEHFGSKQEQVKSEKSPLLKIAAMIIGVLMLSGITYAAIRYVHSSQEQDEKTPETIVVTNSPSSVVDEPLTGQDSTQLEPVVFENAELGTILREVADYYQCEVVYKNQKAKRVRLYFTWDKKASIEDVVETFNQFERIHIECENRKLIVK